jgi:hypothetical protein
MLLWQQVMSWSTTALPRQHCCCCCCCCCSDLLVTSEATNRTSRVHHTNYNEDVSKPLMQALHLMIIIDVNWSVLCAAAKLKLYALHMHNC